MYCHLQLPTCAARLMYLQGLLTDHDQKTGPERVLYSCKGVTDLCSTAVGHRVSAGTCLRAYTDICKT